MKSYAEIVAHLESLGVMPDRPPSLEPMQRALEAMKLPGRIDPAKNLIVAGTNGKGSVSATLSRLLHEAGARVGLYTSPHLVTTRERIRVAEEDLSETAFVEAFLACRETITRERLSHFEALTLMAAWVFHSPSSPQRCEFVIWEVGLGGRWDATNAIPHSPCVMTRLGLDHQNLLGNTLTQIASEKFGVVREGSWVVHSPLPPELEELQTKTRERTKSRWVQAAKTQWQAPWLHTPWGQAKLVLPGPRGAENTATALTAFSELGFRPAKHLSALERVRWPGRFQRAIWPGLRAPLYLSGDHNPQGIESLVEILASIRRKQLHLVVGIGRDKDADTILEILSRLPQTHLHLTETPFKGLRLDEYPARWRSLARSSHAQPFPILDSLASVADPDDCVVVTGSLYLVGQVLKRLQM